jgi:threonine/homoserine/homoserine lactone efflux protein
VAESFAAGAVAGYAIAIPVGAIAVLIIETSIRSGARTGLAAAAGVATADGVYALVAAFVGAAAAVLLAPIEVPLRVAAVFFLVLIAVRGLRAALASRRATAARVAAGRSVRGTYLRLHALTLVNPATVAYFGALVLGLPQLAMDTLARVSFGLGAFLASMSWQAVIALGSAALGARLDSRLQRATLVAGNLVILVFAGLIVIDLIPGGNPS